MLWLLKTSATTQADTLYTAYCTLHIEAHAETTNKVGQHMGQLGGGGGLSATSMATERPVE